VRIIRPHHPLLDQELEVLKADAQRIVVRHFDGGAMKLPRAWTSADSERSSTRAFRPQVYTVAALRELLDLIDALQKRD